MDLNTIGSVIRPATRENLPAFEPGDAFLAGGTWLFSEPQIRLRRLIDLPTLAWPALTITDTTLHIAATCTLAELEAHPWPSSWTAAPLIRQCCRALLGSFKIWKTATVGGNICLALPAAPMISLTAALDGICVIWAPGAERRVPVADFVTGALSVALAPGEILRELEIPISALKRRFAFRQISLTPLGRSAALLIGMRDAAGIHLTITAATPRPIKIDVADDLSAQIESTVAMWHDDVHGAPDWRQHITHLAAHDIVEELKDE